ncbi:hydroxyphenylacetyl-CoA thioesterase PaaI [Roseobacter sp.]|uniref:hydroxyphenylacetyl-CoA thioesterase PaaI n=1 Tax=Roseobacter sp. TaxID=1907202 RepID=UPI0025DE4F10|nr:hydroxyphenylacetyl-CoA thioesterase PaaI [Roseobacter sp.]
MPETVTPQARAEKCAELMMQNDAASRGLGMSLLCVSPGCATLSMTVLPHMLNGHSSCHGGYIFTLADSAFAFACNSYNQRTVAQQNQVTYLAPVQEGDCLTACATETSRSGRSGIWDVTVTNRAGEKVALFRGLARTIGGQHFPEPGETE